METPSEDAAQVSVHAHVAVRVPSPSTTDRTDVFHIVMKINLFPSLLFYVQKHEKYLSDHFSLQPNSKKVKAGCTLDQIFLSGQGINKRPHWLTATNMQMWCQARFGLLPRLPT